MYFGEWFALIGIVILGGNILFFMVVDIEEEVGALLTCTVEKNLSGKKKASNASLRRCLKVEALSTLE